MGIPDDNALNDAALELVLPEAAELTEIVPALITPNRLPNLWPGEEITVKAVTDYFCGKTVVQVDRGGYKEPMQIPKASQDVVEKAIGTCVEAGSLWLLSGPASILGEPIPAGVLNASSTLQAPPSVIAAGAILPGNLADAWKGDTASALGIASALSQQAGKTLPWKTVREVIYSAVNANFLQVAEDSQPWPCDIAGAQFVKLKAAAPASGGGAGNSGGGGSPPSKVLVATADLDPFQIQELGDVVPQLLEIKAQFNMPIRIQVRIEVGDGRSKPSPEIVNKVNAVLKNIKKGFELK